MCATEYDRTGEEAWGTCADLSRPDRSAPILAHAYFDRYVSIS